MQPTDLVALPVPTRDISPPVASSTLALPTATPSSGSDGTVHSNPRCYFKPRVKPTVQPDPAPTRQSARILERGYGYRIPDSIQFLTLCQAYLLQVEDRLLLTWHEADAKSNNATEAKEAALKELRTLINLKSWR